MVDWPEGVPFFTLRSGYGAQPGDNVLRTPMDVGPTKARRRTTAAPSVITGMAYMTREQAQRFEEFWRDTLKDGALSFTMSDGLYRRRNLLTNTEDFSGAGWLRQGAGSGIAPVVTVNAAPSPFGPVTANRLQLDLGGGTTTADQSWITRVGSVGTTLSAWMRSNDGGTYSVNFRNGNSSPQVVSVTVSWQRFVGVNTSGADTTLAIGLRGGISTSDTADILLWGVQLETGSAFTQYEPVGASYRSNDVTRGGLKTYRIVGVPRFDLMGLGHGVPVTLEVLP